MSVGTLWIHEINRRFKSTSLSAAPQARTPIPTDVAMALPRPALLLFLLVVLTCGQEQCSSIGLCDLTESDRHSRIYSACVAIAGRKTLRRSNSSYRRALVWLRDVDRICPDAPDFVQRYVLTVLHYAAGGDAEGWAAEAGGVRRDITGEGLYLNRRHECSWYGVECDERGRVTKLLMEDIGMVGRIPHAIGYLDQLTEVNFGKNQLRGEIPHQVGKLSNLVRLDLDYNEFVGTLPDELFRLEKLEWMDLDNNQFTGTVPAERLGELRNVVLVSLYNNQFTGAVPTGSQLQHMDKLEYLYLDGNDLTGTTDLCREMDDTVFFKVALDCFGENLDCLCPGNLQTCGCCQCF
mmetsp:Transcript_5318/g.11222  ORF Transcript_5318/g.11222 Transcript_5318/m.11222 type:complete len:350 (+) Transcript_5318:148-1197(+)